MSQFRLLIFLLLFLFIPLIGLAQNNISGIIIDENNQPISEVSVKVKSLSVETISDKNGAFEIFAPEGYTLIFKKAGFKKNSRVIKNKQPLQIKLKGKKEVVDKEVTLKGKVIENATGEPLIGVSILVVGTNIGAITNLDGAFELDLPKGAQISIEYGCFSSGQNIHTIEESGYQEFVLFSVELFQSDINVQTSVEKQAFNQGNIHQSLALIQGKVAGLEITKGGGNDPFGDYSVRIRGLSSFNGRFSFDQNRLTNDQPLYVVDGLPMSDISMIDPLTITDFKVIKDGTSARYGIRGANGVIELTTNGLKEKGISYHSYIGIDQPNETLEFMNAKAYQALGRGTVNLGASTDWLDEITRTSISHAHQLSLSGNNNGTRYAIGATFRKAQGILQQQGFDRLQFNGHLQQKAFKDKLTLNARLLTNRQNDNYSQPIAFLYAQTMNPTAPVRNENGEFGGYYQINTFNLYNPVSIIEQNSAEGTKNGLLGSLAAQFDLFSALSLNARYQFSNQNHQQNFYSQKESFYGAGGYRNGYAQKNKRNQTNQFYDVNVAYILPLSGIQTSITLGHQYQKFGQNNLSATGGDFLTDAFAVNNLSAAADFANGIGTVSSNQSSHKLAAFYSDVWLRWTHFTLNAGIRREGSSRLGRNNKWGDFPYAALEYNLGQSLGGFWLQRQAKLRTSFGVAGNVPFTNYLTLENEIVPRGNSFQNGSFQPSYDFNFTETGNPNLKWESTKTFNLGVDFIFNFLKKPLTVKLDVYTSESSDLILPVQRTVATTVFGNTFRTNSYENGGVLNSKGIEGRLVYDVAKKAGFSWQSGLVFSSVKTKLAQYYPADIPFESEWTRISSSPSLGGCCKVATVKLEEGMTIGDIWVLDNIGLSGDGQFIYSDLNRDGAYGEEDHVKAGNGLPNLTLGWTNDLQWRNFDLQLFFQGAFGHQNFNITRKLGENLTQVYSYNVLTTATNEESRRINDFPRESSRYIENASYFRLSNLTIGYNFDAFRFYFTGQNLLTFTGYKGWDPAVRMDSFGDVFGAGYEYRTTYLPTRSFVFGVKMNLK